MTTPVLDKETFEEGREFAKVIVNDINSSVSPHHSVDTLVKILTDDSLDANKRFTEYSEADNWDL